VLGYIYKGVIDNIGWDERMKIKWDLSFFVIVM